MSAGLSPARQAVLDAWAQVRVAVEQAATVNGLPSSPLGNLGQNVVWVADRAAEGHLDPSWTAATQDLLDRMHAALDDAEPEPSAADIADYQSRQQALCSAILAARP